MNAFSRSVPYRLWVLLGIPAIIATAVAPSLNAPPGSSAPITASLVAVAVWVAGLLGLCWRQVAADQKAELSGLGAAAAAGEVPQAHQLLQTLALPGRGDLAAATREMHSFQRNWMLCFVAALVTGGVAVALYLNGAGSGVLGLPVLVVFVSFARMFRTVRLGIELGDAQLEPLGLQISSVPGLTAVPHADGDVGMTVRGATRMVGRRHGHRVDIAVGARDSEVRIDAAAPQLALSGNPLGLEATGGDPRVATALLERIGDDPRWWGVELQAGPDGVVVRRPGGAKADPLLDLWLAERVAELTA